MRDAQPEPVNDRLPHAPGPTTPLRPGRPGGGTDRCTGGRRARCRGGDSAITIDPTCTPAPRAARRITTGPRHPELRAAPPGPAGARCDDLPGVTRDRRAASATEVAPTFPDVRRPDPGARRAGAPQRIAAHVV